MHILRRILLVVVVLMVASVASARKPLYVVGGKVVASIDDIAQENIASIDILPANEETIAEWGIEASEGVILVTLRYDTPASFEADGHDSFTAYLQHKVKWSDDMPAERVSLRLLVDTDGHATIDEVLQSTSRQFLKRVVRAIEDAPRWIPAMSGGKATESIVLLNLQLPEGKSLPVERAVIFI